MHILLLTVININKIVLMRFIELNSSSLEAVNKAVIFLFLKIEYVQFLRFSGLNVIA